MISRNMRKGIYSAQILSLLFSFLSADLVRFKQFFYKLTFFWRGFRNIDWRLPFIQPYRKQDQEFADSPESLYYIVNSVALNDKHKIYYLDS